MTISVVFSCARYEVPSRMLDLLEGMTVYYNGEISASDTSDVIVRLDTGVMLHPLCFKYIAAYFDIEKDENCVKVPTLNGNGTVVGYTTATRGVVTDDTNAYVLTKVPSALIDNSAVVSGKRWLVSCIIPVYNVERYLVEAVESVVAQSIGFEENVQLILVNDGSLDGCGAICESYKAKYSENVVYIEQENRGVSAARNVGLDITCGEFVAFLDGDDRYDARFMEIGVKRFKKNPDLRFVATPVQHFEADSTIDKRFSDKVYTSKEIDTTERLLIVDNVCAGLFRTVAFRTKRLRFNEFFHYEAEISLLANCLSNSYISYIHDLYYFKRVRFANNSASQTSKHISMDSNIVIVLYAKLFDELGDVRKNIPRFAQSIVVWALQRMITVKQSNLSQAGTVLSAEMLNTLKGLADKIDVTILLQKILPLHLRAFLLELKFGRDLISPDAKLEMALQTNKSFSNANPKGIAFNIQPLQIILIYEKLEKLYIRARSRQISDARLRIQSDCEVQISEQQDYYSRSKLTLGGYEIFKEIYYDIQISLDDCSSENISFYMETPYGNIFPIKLEYSQFAKLAYDNLFCLGDAFIIKRTTSAHILSVEKLNKEQLNTYIPTVLSAFKSGVNADSDKAYAQLVSQLLGQAKFLFLGRRIWLFMDRHNEIGNNAETLFRFCGQQRDNIEKWYVVPNESYIEKFHGLTCVVAGTDEFKLLFVFAEKVISSFTFTECITLEWSVNPEENSEKWLNIINFKKIALQFFRGDFIHIQHGVSLGVTCFEYMRHNNALYASLCKKEYEYIQNQDPKTQGIMKLTGLPHYDDLERVKSKPRIKKIVLFAPSFVRQSLNKEAYTPEYKETESFAYINGFLNHPGLLAALSANGYELYFKPHYLLTYQIDDFTIQPGVKVVPVDTDRYALYAEYALAITDYSAIAFDFAYLQKPLIYAQILENSKYEETYFNYERDGFGEICYDMETLVNAVISYIENDCVMPDKYVKRVEDFFTYHDERNCERLYSELLKIPDTRSRLP